MIVMSLRTYSELATLNTFEERYDYLRLDGVVGRDTFGFERYLNQVFYRSAEWRSVRNKVLMRDSFSDDICDLGVEDRPILGRVYVHHMNPIDPKDLYNRSSKLLDPEFLISSSHRTHLAIHYGDENLLDSTGLKERVPNDTIPWRTTERSGHIGQPVDLGFGKNRIGW